MPLACPPVPLRYRHHRLNPGHPVHAHHLGVRSWGDGGCPCRWLHSWQAGQEAGTHTQRGKDYRNDTRYLSFCRGTTLCACIFFVVIPILNHDFAPRAFLSSLFLAALRSALKITTPYLGSCYKGTFPYTTLFESSQLKKGTYRFNYLRIVKSNPLGTPFLIDP